MIAKCLASFLVAASFAASIDVVQAAGNKLFYGAGALTCAEWQQYRKKDDRFAILQLKAYVDGFLTGYNLGSDEIDFLNPKPESVACYAWIDNYCSQKPLDKMVQALISLKDELVKRAH